MCTFIILVLQMRNLRHRLIKQLVWNNSKWQSWNLNSSSLTNGLSCWLIQTCYDKDKYGNSRYAEKWALIRTTEIQEILSRDFRSHNLFPQSLGTARDYHGEESFPFILMQGPGESESPLRSVWLCLHIFPFWRWTQGLGQRNQALFPSKHPQGLCQYLSIRNPKMDPLFASLCYKEQNFMSKSGCFLPNDKLVRISLLQSSVTFLWLNQLIPL